MSVTWIKLRLLIPRLDLALSAGWVVMVSANSYAMGMELRKIALEDNCYLPFPLLLFPHPTFHDKGRPNDATS